MSTSSDHYPDQDAPAVEDARVASWRFDQLRSLGFGAEQSLLLAVSSADLNLTRSLVAAGCPLHLVVRIVG